MAALAAAVIYGIAWRAPGASSTTHSQARTADETLSLAAREPSATASGSSPS